jgi:hypothetical protein
VRQLALTEAEWAALHFYLRGQDVFGESEIRRGPMAILACMEKQDEAREQSDHILQRAFRLDGLTWRDFMGRGENG